MSNEYIPRITARWSCFGSELSLWALKLIQTTHIFGKARIIPVILYYQNFNDKLGIEANLPANFRLRYTPNSSRTIYGGVEVNGAKYKLAPSTIDEPFFLEKSELRTSVTYEQEIHDWLWVGLSLGHRHAISFDVSSVNGLSSRTGDRILDTSVADTYYYNLSIFLVAPRNMFK